MKFLVGKKVFLRPVERADASVIAPWFNDERVRRTTTRYRPLSIAAEEKFIEAMGVSETDVFLGIVLLDSERLVGACGLHHLDARNRHCELGIVIGEVPQWGRGIASEVTRLLVDYAFGTLNLNRVWLRVFADNTPAIRVYEKSGFKLEGVLRQDTFRDGRWVDIHTMAILRDEHAAPSRSDR